MSNAAFAFAFGFLAVLVGFVFAALVVEKRARPDARSNAPEDGMRTETSRP